jgi:hypothetical protein
MRFAIRRGAVTGMRFCVVFGIFFIAIAQPVQRFFIAVA